jgi:hypothetical protein
MSSRPMAYGSSRFVAAPEKAAMSQVWIDSFTRAVAAPAVARPAWRTFAASTLAGMYALFGGNAGQAPVALAAADPGCLVLNHDATCPDGLDKKPKASNKPTVNGCGAEGGSIKIPQGYGAADYTGSCNSHDVCYEECFTPKQDCDDVFLEDMYDSCAATYPGALNGLLRFGCYERANVYYQAVAQFGDDAWVAAQQKACQCCKSKVYCNCNQKCYTSVSQCLDECEATLGCFTGICGPAEPDQCPA